MSLDGHAAASGDEDGAVGEQRPDAGSVRAVLMLPVSVEVLVAGS